MSRRFKGRHAKVQANPKARPVKAPAFDDSNSFADPQQPDCRKPKQLNGRSFVTAGVVAELEADAAAKKAAAEKAAKRAQEA